MDISKASGTLATLRVLGYGRVSSLCDEVSTIALWRFFAAVCANNNKFGR